MGKKTKGGFLRVACFVVRSVAPGKTRIRKRNDGHPRSPGSDDETRVGGGDEAIQTIEKDGMGSRS